MSVAEFIGLGRLTIDTCLLYSSTTLHRHTVTLETQFMHVMLITVYFFYPVFLHLLALALMSVR